MKNITKKIIDKLKVPVFNNITERVCGSLPSPPWFGFHNYIWIRVGQHVSDKLVKLTYEKLN